MIKRVDDFGFDVWEKTANGVDAFLYGIVCGGHGGDGGCLGHAVADGEFCEVEDFVQFAHEFCGDRAASRYTGAEVLEAFVGDGAVVDEFQLSEKHGGNTVESSGFLFLHSFQGGLRIEGFRGKDNSRAVCCSCHIAKDATKAMEERWRTDNDVLGSEEHAITDLVAIVEDGPVGETCSFRSGRRARGELDVDYFSIRERRVRCGS